MRPPVAPEAPDDELARAFPGCVLSHVILVFTADAWLVAREGLAALSAAAAELHGLHLARTGEGYEMRLQFGGPPPRAARALAEKLATLPGVSRALVEHRIGRAQADAGPLGRAP